MSIKISKTLQAVYKAVVIVCLCPCMPVMSEENKQSFIYWRGAMTEGRKPYETELIRLLVKVSEDKYGPAEVEVSEQPMSGTRGRFQLKSGRGVDIITAPLLYDYEPGDTSIVLEHNILRNLLGYRRLIIRAEDSKKFDALASFEQLNQYSLGQGRSWRDARVYTHADMPMINSPSLQNLFPMLKRKRFDYIPVGAGEVEAGLKAYTPQGSHFMAADNIVIYYSWPVRIFVGELNPKLAERLDYGWKLAQESGEIDALYDRYFSDLINGMNTPETRLLILENPYLPREQNTQPELLDRARLIYDFRNP